MTKKLQGLFLATVVASTGLVTACGGSHNVATTGNNGEPVARHGLSNGRKVALLVGSAALYYMLKKNQEQRQQGQSVSQYFLSKNGRVYYRDRDGAVHWVTAPQGGMQVPESEAQAYNVDQYQGYNGRDNGRGLAGLDQSTH